MPLKIYYNLESIKKVTCTVVLFAPDSGGNDISINQTPPGIRLFPQG